MNFILITTINIESKLPTVEQARIRLEQGLRTARSQQQTTLKIIHGYGSTGKGGAIKKDTALFLAEQKKSGKIKDFLPGEYFSPFDPSAQKLLSEYPDLYKDTDYSRDNYGITLVFL